MPKFQAFFKSLEPKDIYRCKGILRVESSLQKFVFHGVHDVFDFEFSDHCWDESEVPQNKIVIIGRNLERRILLEKLRDCMVQQ